MVAELNVKWIPQSGFGAFYPRMAKCPVFNWSLMVVCKKVLSSVSSFKNAAIVSVDNLELVCHESK